MDFPPSHSVGQFQRNRAVGPRLGIQIKNAVVVAVFARQLAFYAVEGLHRLACLGAAHDDPATFKQVEIKSMRRLADFQKRVVAGVHRVADGARVEQSQAIRNTGRGRSDADTANDSCREARAEFRFLNFDGEIGRRLGFWQLGLNRLQWNVVDGRGFACYAVMVHRIGTVRSDLRVEDRLVAVACNAFNGHAGVREVLGKSPVVDLQVNEFAEPLRGEFHLFLSSFVTFVSLVVKN